MPRSHRSILSKFRCGTLPLEIELGRYSRPKTPLNERLCTHCNDNAVEDELHFLVNCDYYSDLRYTLWKDLSYAHPSFTFMTPEEKLVFLLNNHDVVKLLAALLYKMIRRRNLS